MVILGKKIITIIKMISDFSFQKNPEWVVVVKAIFGITYLQESKTVQKTEFFWILDHGLNNKKFRVVWLCFFIT